MEPNLNFFKFNDLNRATNFSGFFMKLIFSFF